MDLNTVAEIRDGRVPAPWRPGDAWLGGGTYLFSEPQPWLRRLVDLSRTGWTPLERHPDGSLEIAATCTVAQLSRYGKELAEPAAPLFERCCRAFLASFKIWNMATVGGNLCNGLPAGPMISLTAALDGECLLLAQDGVRRRVRVADFVTGAGRTVRAEGELLRSVTLPARALACRTAFRQASLYGLGRSGVLVIGALDPADGSLAVTVTAATVRPVRLWFPLPPSAPALRAAIEAAVADDEWFDDIHGLPAWRRHMTLRYAEEIRRELGDLSELEGDDEA
ncbi:MULTISPECIES: FAD binding domain-containing protein [unclassified Streptomyces]|uniref:FAD binding domain-containing protein n=1 Tax=unclassified Streptomyces TaxID=2593676 RepID=UPI000DBA8C70|nr:MULTISPECIES: FAD binding domain-containing protein [unclassified Streptomyces]MYT74095.1 FAD-binding molybdopterin dehydrogenase [Streptomyces sp. SID8367]RAJ89512.1 CO/xanthine dehydrogenase FAD-binding subunit [Streptomyces sp. PsTaAH-137]